MQKVQVLGNISIEESLKLDNITYTSVPAVKKEASFVSADVVTFTEQMLSDLVGQTIRVEDNTKLYATMTESFGLKNQRGEYAFEEFLEKYVLFGKDYTLWEIKKDAREAIFFQNVKGHPIYYSTNAMLTIHWNEDEKIIAYEQKALEEFDLFNHKKDLLSQYEAVGSLASRGYLKPNSTVRKVDLGYSTLVQLTGTQVFAPTWNVQVELKDGQKEHYFINAVEGKVIEFQTEQSEDEKF